MRHVGHSRGCVEDVDETRRQEKPNDSIDEVECVRVVESVQSNTSRGGASEDNDEERRAGEPYEQPDEPYNESRDPEEVQVDPGADTDVKRNESVAPESADTVIDGEVAGTCQAAQVEGQCRNTSRGVDRGGDGVQRRMSDRQRGLKKAVSATTRDGRVHRHQTSQAPQ